MSVCFQPPPHLPSHHHPLTWVHPEQDSRLAPPPPMSLFEGTSSFRLEHQASPQFSLPDSHILLRILGVHVQGLSNLTFLATLATVSLASSSVAAPVSLGERSHSLCFLWSVEAALPPLYSNRPLDFPCHLNSRNSPPLSTLPCTVTLVFLCWGGSDRRAFALAPQWPEMLLLRAFAAQVRSSLALHSILSPSSSSSHIPCSMFP